MATFQLNFQTGRAKELIAPCIILIQSATPNYEYHDHPQGVMGSKSVAINKEKKNAELSSHAIYAAEIQVRSVSPRTVLNPRMRTSTPQSTHAKYNEYAIANKNKEPPQTHNIAYHRICMYVCLIQSCKLKPANTPYLLTEPAVCSLHYTLRTILGHYQEGSSICI